MGPWGGEGSPVPGGAAARVHTVHGVKKTSR